MKNFLTLFVLFGHTFIYAQIKYNAKPKMDREVQILLDEGKKCLEIPEKECEHFFLEAITYGKDHKVAYLDYLYFQLGYYFDARSQYDSSLYYTKKAYELTDNNDANSAYPKILNSMGVNYYRRGDYENAIKFIQLTVKVEETQDNPLSLTYAYNNLGTIMGTNENYDEAIKYYKKGYRILEEIKDTTIIANLAANIAIYKIKVGDSLVSRNWALKAIDLAEKYNTPSAYCYGNYIMGTTEPDLNQSLVY